MKSIVEPRLMLIVVATLRSVLLDVVLIKGATGIPIVQRTTANLLLPPKEENVTLISWKDSIDKSELLMVHAQVYHYFQCPVQLMRINEFCALSECDGDPVCDNNYKCKAGTCVLYGGVTNTGGCFSGDDSVRLAHGQPKAMRDLRVGDQVWGLCNNESVCLTEVIRIPHADSVASCELFCVLEFILLFLIQSALLHGRN